MARLTVRIGGVLREKVSELAKRLRISEPETIRRSVELHNFVAEKLDQGLEFTLLDPASQTHTKVDFTRF